MTLTPGQCDWESQDVHTGATLAILLAILRVSELPMWVDRQHDLSKLSCDCDQLCSVVAALELIEVTCPLRCYYAVGQRGSGLSETAHRNRLGPTALCSDANALCSVMLLVSLLYGFSLSYTM